MKPQSAKSVLDQQLGLSFTAVEIPENAMPLILKAMKVYANQHVNYTIEQTDKQERKMVYIMFGYFVKLTWQEFILYLRAKSLKRHKRIAQRLANDDNRMYYIIRDSEIGYRRFSTADIDLNKRLHIMGKDVDFKKLHEVADAVIYKKKTETNKEYISRTIIKKEFPQIIEWWQSLEASLRKFEKLQQIPPEERDSAEKKELEMIDKKFLSIKNNGAIPTSIINKYLTVSLNYHSEH